jgi:hypothetical protein
VTARHVELSTEQNNTAQQLRTKLETNLFLIITP